MLLSHKAYLVLNHLIEIFFDLFFWSKIRIEIQNSINKTSKSSFELLTLFSTN